MNYSKFIVISLISLMLICCVTACKQTTAKPAKKTIQTAIATVKSNTTVLYYNGIIQPIQIKTVISPADGNIEDIDFKYGQRVSENQVLLILTSAKYQEDYRNAISDYLKARDAFSKAADDFRATKELHAAKIISEQEYVTQKSAYETANLTLINAGYTLKKALTNIRGADENEIQNLKLENIDQVKHVLERQYDKLEITSPSNGVILFPDKSGDSDTKSAKELSVGAEIKKGELLVAVGDLFGLALTLQVEEVNVDKLKLGQEVIVSPAAFSDIDLPGTIKTIASQAKGSSGSEGGVATFPVVVNVPVLTPRAAKVIRVGMSAKVKITIKNPPNVTVPVNAIFEKDGESMVTVIDPKTKAQKDVIVDTGAISVSEVQILNGLKQGDEVLLHD